MTRNPYLDTLPKPYLILIPYRTIAYLNRWLEDPSWVPGPIPHLKTRRVFHYPILLTHSLTTWDIYSLRKSLVQISFLTWTLQKFLAYLRRYHGRFFRKWIIFLVEDSLFSKIHNFFIRKQVGSRSWPVILILNLLGNLMKILDSNILNAS